MITRAHYPLRNSACATQRALYKELSRDPETIQYRLPMLLIKDSALQIYDSFLEEDCLQGVLHFHGKLNQLNPYIYSRRSFLKLQLVRAI